MSRQVAGLEDDFGLDLPLLRDAVRRTSPLRSRAATLGPVGSSEVLYEYVSVTGGTTTARRRAALWKFSMCDSPAPYPMICHFEFASSGALDGCSRDPAMAEVRAEVANITDITPTVMLGKSL